MRNLRNVRHETWRDEEPQDPDTLSSRDITSICWDAARNEVLATIGPCDEAGQIELVRLTTGKTPDGTTTHGTL